MEQNISPYDLEYMKRAMLKQEEIFKQQVYELHRLYQIQKLLMRTPQRIYSKNEHTRVPSERKQMRNLLLELERPSERSLNGDQPSLLDNFAQYDGPIDLTLGLGTCYSSQTSDNNNKLPATRVMTSDSVMSFSSSSTGSSSHSKKAGGRGRIDDVEYYDRSRQQDRAMLEQPPWLLQVLSLNMT